MRYLFLYLFFLSGMAYGQDAIADLKLEQKLSILKDKAFFLFPATAANIARQSDIMAADPNAERETRIILDRGEKRLVFFAEEVYATAGNNLLSGIRSNEGKHAVVKALDRSDGLVAVQCTPQIFDTTKGAILINRLIVKTTDKTIFRISAFINPKAFPDKDKFQRLSERVFSSLSKGSRTLNTKARREVIPVLNGRKMLHIDLPENYIVSIDKKYDFEVLRFRKIVNFFDTTWFNFTVYLGHHPSNFYPDYNFSENQQEQASAMFLGKERKWMLFKNEEQRVFLKEQQFPAGELEEGLLIHIAMAADRLHTISELDGIVSGIKFADP